MTEAKKLGAPYDLLLQVHETGRLPVVNFAAGGIATPADAALMMHLGADGVFVGSGIFKSENPEKYAKAIVQATTHYEDYGLIAEAVQELGHADDRNRNFHPHRSGTDAGAGLVIGGMTRMKIGVLALQGAVGNTFACWSVRGRRRPR